MSEKIPNPNTIHPIAGYDKEINALIPILTNSDLEFVKCKIKEMLAS